MKSEYVNIHTHRPTGHGIELRTAGIHPWQAGKEDTAVLEELPAGVQAIGEIGLDFASDADRKAQMALFRAQLTLACKKGLPVVLHCVRAFGEVMKELAAAEPRAVIFHGFIGSPEEARRALDKGYFLSFGERTFASPKTIKSLEQTPVDQLFIETDESDTPIEAIYARIAAIKGISVGELQRATTENYERIFTHG